MKEVLSVDSMQAPSVDSPISNGDDDNEVIEYWLTVDSARARLNGQLALILQSVYDITKSNRDYEIDSLSFKYCPMCNKELHDNDQSDAWVQGKKCAKGHNFYERGGELRHRETITIVEEMQGSSVIHLVNAWLKDKQLLKQQINKEIRGVLERFRKKVA
jgi:hypothetical protein